MASILTLWDDKGNEYLYANGVLTSLNIEPEPKKEEVPSSNDGATSYYTNRLSTTEKFMIVVADDIAKIQNEFDAEFLPVKEDWEHFKDVEVDQQIQECYDRLEDRYHHGSRALLLDDEIYGKADDGIYLDKPHHQTKIVSAWGNELGFKDADLHIDILEPIKYTKVDAIGDNWSIKLKTTKVVQNYTRGVLTFSNEVEENEYTLTPENTDILGSYDYFELLEINNLNGFILNFWRE